MALAFWGAANKFGLSFDFFEMSLFLFSLIVVSFIDLKHMILPDVFTLSGIGIGLAGSFLSSQRNWTDSALGVFFGGGMLWAIAYFYLLLKKQEGMGGGDIKLLAWIGAVLGVQAIPFVVLFASVTGSLAGLVAATRSKEGLKTAIPFGPFLSFGAVAYVFFGQAVTDWYLVFVSLR
jgi:leader peptidase (prepilin peptidase)/N-methyltransferase